MNAYRKKMINEGGNMGWCRPYITDDGKIAFIVCEGVVQAARINGAELETTPYNINRPQELTPEAYAKLAEALHGEEYYLYDGYTDKKLIFAADVTERDCRDCPYFADCQAMDDCSDE